MNLLLSYPIWYLLFCLLAGAVYSSILYLRNKKTSELGKWTLLILSTLRFIVVTLLAILLLNPLLKSISLTSEKPVIVFVQDNSMSILQNKDSLYYKGQYISQVKNLTDELRKKYDVDVYTTGDGFIKRDIFNFSDKVSNYEDLTEQIPNLYAGRNLGAVIFAADGLFNKGVNPIYTIAKIPSRIITIALGDTAKRKDLYITGVSYNKIAYLNNKFPVEVRIGADYFKNTKVAVSIQSEGKVIARQEFTPSESESKGTVNFLIDADKPGVRKYAAVIENGVGEITYVNNRYTFYVEVLDGRKKILILTEMPHPDAGALFQAIQSAGTYEAEIQYTSDFNGNILNYNLLVIYQIPSLTYDGTNIITKATEKGIPVWYFTGARTALSSFNNLNTGLRISGQNGKTDDAGVYYNSTFQSFVPGSESIELLKSLPPLSSPFGKYDVSPGNEILFYRKVGNVQTDIPAMWFRGNAGKRIAVTNGEGIWRWRLEDYERTKSHTHFNELIQKTIQYLSVTDDKSKFRVLTESSWPENENIIIDAELYNNSYEPVNEPDVRIKIENESKKTFDYTFSRTSSAYRLNAGKLKAGVYNYTAETSFNGNKYTKSGSFTVESINLEVLRTSADYDLMYRIAKESGGKMFVPSEMAKIPTLIESYSDVKPISGTDESLRNLIDLKWIFFLLLVLLSVEWFIRKYHGYY